MHFYCVVRKCTLVWMAWQKEVLISLGFLKLYSDILDVWELFFTWFVFMFTARVNKNWNVDSESLKQLAEVGSLKSCVLLVFVLLSWRPIINSHDMWTARLKLFPMEFQALYYRLYRSHSFSLRQETRAEFMGSSIDDWEGDGVAPPVASSYLESHHHASCVALTSVVPSLVHRSAHTISQTYRSWPCRMAG